MHLSWEIQHKQSYRLKQKQNKTSRSIRSLAVEAAWTIMNTEEITVGHLVKRYSHEHHPNKVNPKTLTLFQ